MTTEIKPKTSILKKILYIIACVLVLILIAGLLMPKEINISLKRSIDVPANYAYNLANNQMSAPLWNAWIIEDKETNVVYDQIVQGKGSGYSWTSKKNGNGSILYTDVVQDKKINADLMMGGTKSSYIQTFVTENGKSHIQWDFNTHMSYPKNAFAPFLKYIINKKNKQSIDNMVSEVKKRQKAEYFGYSINEGSQNPRYFLTSRSTVSFDQISQFYTQNLAAIYQKLQNEGITASGAPCAIYYAYNEISKKADMAVAVPVLTSVAVKDLESVNLPIQNAATVDYYGDPSKNQLAHYALNEYVLDRYGLSSQPIIEEYLSDPLKEKDPSKWLTKIYYYTTEKK
jgi:effector-binding domain-containing protein